jgi:assimilatory nitrate reductase catalytic subunit
VTDLDAVLAGLGIAADLGDQIDYGDVKSGDLRRAIFTGDQLAAFVKISAKPTRISRSWAAGQLSEDFSDKHSRFKIVSGRPAQGMPDKGPIICSCFSVGSLEISAAVQKGCCSVADIGKALKAGTNCGSCKSEIKTLIERNMPLAAE